MRNLEEQDQTSNRYDSILQWLWMVYGLRVTHRLSYPKSRDAIASKNVSFWYVKERFSNMDSIAPCFAMMIPKYS